MTLVDRPQAWPHSPAKGPGRSTVFEPMEHEPHPRAAAKAAELRTICAELDLAVAREIVDEEGSVHLVLFGLIGIEGGAHRHIATMTCDSDGEVVVLIEDRLDADVLNVWLMTDDDIDASLDRIAAHVRQGE